MALTFEQYQKQALETNLGTIINETEPLLYPVMGMVDELSEVMENRNQSNAGGGRCVCVYLRCLFLD